MLRSLLEQECLLPIARYQVGCALTHPACWPAERSLASRALAHGFTPPAEPPSGTALLVSMAPDRSALWTLGPGAKGFASAPLVNHAKAAFAVAHSLALRNLPVMLERPEDLGALSWQPALVVREGRGIDRQLDGSSFGLSFFLSAVSRLLDLPVPGDVAASAALSPGGSLLPVDGLREKIEVLAHWGLGLKRFFVASEQVDEAATWAEAAGAAFRVVPLPSVWAAVEEVFGDVEARIGERLQRTGAISEAVESIFDLALLGESRTIDWEGVERGAAVLLGLLDAEDSHRFKPELARLIAMRHQGKPALIPLPASNELDLLHPELKDHCLAHVIQSCGDVAAAERRRLLEETRARLPDPRRSRLGELQVHGAIGRALCTLRLYDDAAEQLRATVGGWEACRRLDEVSYSLCAWIHVSGIRRDRDAIDEAIRVAERAPLGAKSAAYFAFNCGRALMLAGDPSRALAWLADAAANWAQVDGHLRRSRLRWLAAAHRASGDLDRAARVVDALRREGHCMALELALLDVALYERAPVEGFVGACLATNPDLVPAYLDLAAAPREQAEALAREYPY